MRVGALPVGGLGKTDNALYLSDSWPHDGALHRAITRTL
jgi:hypothetical protein